MSRSIRNAFVFGLGLSACFGCGYSTFGKSSLGLSGPVNLGLVGHWSFDESVAGTASGGADFEDGSGYGSPATAQSGVTFGVAGRFGSGARFNGATYASVPHGSALNVGNAVTVAAWIYPTSLAGRGCIFSTRRTNLAGSFQVEVGAVNSGTNAIAVTTPGIWNAQSANNVLALNTWNHVVYTRDGTTAGHQKFYLNGVAQTLTIDNPVAFVDNSDPVDIGQGLITASPFTGTIDEVSVWSRALSSTEIAYLYSSNLVPYLGP